MFFKKGRPNQHIRHLGPLGHRFSEGLARTDCAKTAAAFANSLGCRHGGCLVTNCIEDIFELWGDLCNLFGHIAVAVVECVLGSELLDFFMVAWATGGDYLEAVVLCDLNGI